VVHFPFTNGFVSALLLQYKIIPALRAYAEEHKADKGPVVIVSTCSEKQQMCTHYAPLYKGKTFLLGQKDMYAHLAEIGPESMIDWQGMKRGLMTMFPFLKSKKYE
jgi:hypothetical protein